MTASARHFEALRARSAGALRGYRTDLLVAFAIMAAVGLWWVSLPSMNPDDLDDFGLVAILPWSFWVALASLSAGFAISLQASLRWRGLRLAALVVLVLLLHATPPLVYGTLRYSWAWKHIGIVDYIQRHSEVNRTIRFLSAYHNWPGFFWISAWLADLFHLGPLQIANLVRFFPFVANLVSVVLLRSVYLHFTRDLRLVYAALWLFLAANWVGQDYFSPQAFAFALYLGVIVLCLGPLMPGTVPTPSGVGLWIWRIRTRLTQFRGPGWLLAPPWKILAVLAFVAAIMTIVASHQLTPIILLFALTGLALVTPLGIGYPILLLFALAYWISYPAAPFTAQALPEELAQLGNTIGGVTDKMVNTAAASFGVSVVAWAGRVLAAGIVLLALFGALRRYRGGERDGIPAVLAVAPFFLLGVSAYGGEAVFRVYLFSSPFLAFFAAAAVFPRRLRSTGAAARLVFGLLAFLVSAGFLFANNGKDGQYRFSQNEVQAAAWLYGRSVPGTLLVEGARNYPSQFMNYEDFTFLPLANESSAERAKILDDPAAVLHRWFTSPEWTDGYVILTRSQEAYVEALGIMPEGALEQVSLELLGSPDFVLVFANKDARVFRASRFQTH